jgi:hypothetical protein
LSLRVGMKNTVESSRSDAYWEPLAFELPETSESEPWCPSIDTSLKTPDNIVPRPTVRATADQRSYAAGPRSVVVLGRQVARANDRAVQPS